MKRITTLITLIAGLAFTGSASAFAGPWDSAHQPPTITNPGVSISSDSTSFNVDVRGVACPGGVRAPLTVTIYMPDGQVVESLGAEAVAETTGSGCYYDQVSTESIRGDIFAAFVGDTVSISLNSLGTPESGYAVVEPILYTVSGPSGVLAQGSLTYMLAPQTSTEIDDTNIDAFINICINGNHQILSKNGGTLYCTIGGGGGLTVTAAWPAPPKPPTPPPVVTPKAPKVTAHPAGRTRSQTATFRFTDSTRGVTYKCRLDRQGPWRTCSGIARYTRLARNRAHTFEVSATLHGRTSTITRFTWKVVK